MRYVQVNNVTLFQKVVLFLLLIAFLVGAFFLAMALLPLLLIAGIYIWYKVRKTAKQMREAQERMYQDVEFQESRQQEYSRNFIHLEEIYREHDKPEYNEDVYDISPENYTFEDKDNTKN